MNLQDLLKSFDCKCGKTHSCGIENIYIEENAMLHLKELCIDYNNILLVADENTYEAAGEKTEKYINEKIIDRVIFSGKEILVPNESAVNSVSCKISLYKNTDSEIDLIIGIGSGCIQDLCKYVSFNNNLPYFIVATSPSMDGYASTGAAMIMGGMKVTYSAKVPTAIIADTEVLCNAPMEMIKAGYGDIIGKYSALNDWKLSRVVNGEFFCPYIYDLTYKMLCDTVPLAKKLLLRDKESIKTLMVALIGVGIAMSYAGNSRPASGSEHHLSHFFEITGIIDNEAYLSHGTDVAYSTVITAKLREKLAKASFPQKCFSISDELYKSEMKKIYKEVSDGCIALQTKLGTYTTDRSLAYIQHETEIKQILNESPKAFEIEKLLKDIDLDMQVFYNTYSNEKIINAVRFAKDLKDRYTVLWMYFDIFGVKEIDLM